MHLLQTLRTLTAQTLTELYKTPVGEQDFQINDTIQDYTGDYTIVLFPLLKKIKVGLPQLGESLGNALKTAAPHLIAGHNLVKGFLNLEIAGNYWTHFLQQQAGNSNYGLAEPTGKNIMVEYSSPNTNKPLHLGHLRNIFLGWSTAEILKATGNKVIKTSIVNDRGIHICKSMYAWQQLGKGETPQTSGKKGDHLVGEYYVKFENILRSEVATLLQKEATGDFSHYASGLQERWDKLQDAENKIEPSKEAAEKLQKIAADKNELRRAATPVMQQVTKMLQGWEAGDENVLQLWRQMNGWVYDGMDATYNRIGADFDKTYYESNTYLLGKDLVQKGLTDGVFYKKEDGSVWVDLTADGLDEKLVLRKDGTSVYITQDIGLGLQKYEEYGIDSSIYVIGDEQNYHMKVLQLISKKLGLPYANNIHHLSYGMVELPDGKMKSREGTVVDADDMVSDMVKEAEAKTQELGKVSEFTKAELKELNETIGIGALKFFLLRIDPKKRMIFNPKESIDFHGFTAPYIQFNHARICSILKKENITEPFGNTAQTDLFPLEKNLLLLLEKFPCTLQNAAAELNPSVVAAYAYQVAKAFSSFYTEHSISKAETEIKKHLRLNMALLTARVLKRSMNILGIGMPEKM